MKTTTVVIEDGGFFPIVPWNDRQRQDRLVRVAVEGIGVTVVRLDTKPDLVLPRLVSVIEAMR